MGGASGFKKQANVGAPRLCILVFVQQGPPNTVALRTDSLLVAFELPV